MVVVGGGGVDCGGGGDIGALQCLARAERLSCGPRHGYHHTYSTGRDGS